MASDSYEWNVGKVPERSHGTSDLSGLSEIGDGTCPMWNESRSSKLGLREQKAMTHVASSRLHARMVWALGMIVQRLSHHAGWALERRGMTARFEERVRERERIARELHDTLLQGTQALLLSVQALSTRLRPDDPMRDMLTDTLRRADVAMTQGRDRIQNLRAATGAAVDLAESLANAWRDLGGECELRIIVEGPPRELEPDAGDEISLIEREALANALRHSKAKVIEAEIVFCDDELRLCIRDDGVGLGKKVLGSGSPAGYWGLSGMRERAQRLLASLVI
ncbi:MAG: histidine kinase [Burkholderiaceae bacterium]